MNTTQWRRPVVVAILIALALAGAPATSVQATSQQAASPLETTLQRLSDILVRLEGELSVLEAPRAERVEQGVEAMIELTRELLDEMSSPKTTSDDVGRRIARLRTMLHRLVSALETAIDTSAPARPSAREVVDDLRNWVDGYLDGLTAGMDPGTADRIESAAHQMVRDLVVRFSQVIDSVRQNASSGSRLESLIEQLTELTIRMDRLLRQRFGSRNAI